MLMSARYVMVDASAIGTSVGVSTTPDRHRPRSSAPQAMQYLARRDACVPHAKQTTSVGLVRQPRDNGIALINPIRSGKKMTTVKKNAVTDSSSVRSAPEKIGTQIAAVNSHVATNASPNDDPPLRFRAPE